MSKAKKKLREDNRIDNWSYLWMAMFTAAGFLFFNVFYSFFGELPLKVFDAVIIVGLLGGLIYSKWKKTDSERKTIYVILLISIVLRLYYIITTSGTTMSGPDYDTFCSVQENLTLPEAFQPLYYIVAAFIYNTMALTEFTAAYSLDIVRAATEFMGIVAAIAVYYILCELEINDTAVYIGTGIIALHPGLIRLGGEISPLLPMFAAMCLGIMFLTRWNNFTDGFDFVFMSVSFGIATMLNMSALIFTPVIATLVIINLVRVFKRKNATNTISSIIQTLCGVGAWTVLCFAYPLRNMLKGSDTGLMKLLGNTSGSLDFKSKFFSFELNELLEVFVDPQDKNAWIYLVKSSVFGNLTANDIELEFVVLQAFIAVAFACAAISGLTVFGNMIARIDAKKKVNVWTLIAMTGCAVGYYILQNLGSTSASTMDFRVVPIILAIGVIMLCHGIKVLSMKKKLSFVSQILYLLTVIVCLAFCVGSVVYGCWFV